MLIVIRIQTVLYDIRWHNIVECFRFSQVRAINKTIFVIEEEYVWVSI